MRIAANALELERLRVEDNDLCRKVAVVRIIKTIYSILRVHHFSVIEKLTLNKVSREHLHFPRSTSLSSELLCCDHWIFGKFSGFVGRQDVRSLLPKTVPFRVRIFVASTSRAFVSFPRMSYSERRGRVESQLGASLVGEEFSEDMAS